MVSPFLLRERASTTRSRRTTRAAHRGSSPGMIAIAVVTGVARRRADLALEHRRPARDARPARAPSTATCSASRSPSSRARAPARCSRASPTTSAASSSVVTSHRDVDRLERDDGRSRRSSRCSCSTGAWPSFSLALLPFFVWLTRRVGERAPAHHHRAPEDAGRHLDAGRGVAVGLGHPARQDDGPLAPSSPSASSGESARARRPRGARSAWPAAG